MAVMMCREIVQTVGKSKSLRICQSLTHLLDTSVDVSAVYVKLLDDLTLKTCSESKYTMRCRMLRTDVDHIFILSENDIPLLDYAAVRLELIILCSI